jgi:hypothetical protein
MFPPRYLNPAPAPTYKDAQIPEKAAVGGLQEPAAAPRRRLTLLTTNALQQMHCRRQCTFGTIQPATLEFGYGSRDFQKNERQPLTTAAVS